ncbi:MAG: cytochrome-c peroxidase, partial [Methylococcaceae bacterium]|nr:cytochrome-c peroxidase [Methylococcaceae bacterium]
MRFRRRMAMTILMLALAHAGMADELVLPGGKKLSLKARLGQKLFFDTNLSSPPGQSCATCHDPAYAFSDPDQNTPTSVGALPRLKGKRNAPTVLYAAYSPPFRHDRTEGYSGGQFLDGRKKTLVDQAKGPFLNPLEMANPNAATVVDKVRRADYADLFEQIYDAGSLTDDLAFDHIADAIAAFERSPVFKRFSSKYDYYLYGQ